MNNIIKIMVMSLICILIIGTVGANDHIDVDSNNTNSSKTITLPETGTSLAILIGAVLVLFVVCLAYWRE